MKNCILLSLLSLMLTLNVYSHTHSVCTTSGRKGQIIYQYFCSNIAAECKLQSIIYSLNDFISDKYSTYRQPIYIQWGYTSEVELFYENFFGEYGNHSLALTSQEETLRKNYKPGILPDTSQKSCIKLILPSNYLSRQDILLLIDYALQNENKLITLFNEFGNSNSDNYENLSQHDVEIILNNPTNLKRINPFAVKEYTFKIEGCKLIFSNDKVKIKNGNRLITSMTKLDNLIFAKRAAILLFENDSSFHFYNLETKIMQPTILINRKKNKADFVLEKFENGVISLSYIFYEYPRINGLSKEITKKEIIELSENTGKIIGRKTE